MRTAQVLATSLLLLGASAALADYDYEPADDAANRLTVAQARQLLESALQPNAKDIACFAARGDRLVRVTGRFASIHYELTPLDRRDGPTLRFAYELAPRPKLRYVTQGSIGKLRMELGPARESKEPVALECNVDDAPWTGEGAKRLADALRRLQRGNEAGDGAAAEAAFRDQAARERAAAAPLPEEVRRLRIQAESALRSKRLDEAAERYAQALAIDPWWPEGRYNRATVLAELGAYRSAAREMRRYLVLLPDAPDARRIEDQIRDWERRIPPN